MKSILVSLALCAALGSTCSSAQEWPSRPVTIVVPTAAGTGMDTLVRHYSEKLSAALGKPVLAENKPGAALTLAAAHVAASPADGYTLLISTATPMVVAPVLFKQLRYDPQKDLVPILVYAKSPFVLVANPALNAQGLGYLVALAKAQGSNPLSYASTGAGSSQHLAMEFLKKTLNFNATHVPYKSSPQSIQDIAAGHVAMGFVESGLATPLILSGKLRAIVASSADRLPGLPQVETISEAAKLPGFEAVSWHVLAAPAQTPKPVVERILKEMTAIMADPDMSKRIESIGLLPVPPRPLEATVSYLASERSKWGQLVRSLGLEKSQ